MSIGPQSFPASIVNLQTRDKTYEKEGETPLINPFIEPNADLGSHSPFTFKLTDTEPEESNNVFKTIKDQKEGVARETSPHVKEFNIIQRKASPQKSRNYFEKNIQRKKVESSPSLTSIDKQQMFSPSLTNLDKHVFQNRQSTKPTTASTLTPSNEDVDLQKL